MSDAKIFISYSGRKSDPDQEPGERPDGDLAKVLFDHLEASPGIRPWRDAERLQTGSRWSDKISEALATCHGAIILLSDISKKSEYVRHEVSYLTVRKDNEGDRFPFIPLWLGEEAEVPGEIGDYFAAINLDRFQFKPIAYGSALPIDQIIPLLKPARKAAQAPPTFKAAVEQQLAADLRNLYNVEEGTFRWVARRVGWISEDQETNELVREDWNHEDAVARLFVRRLMAAPINKQFSAIENLKVAAALNEDRSRRHRLFERVAPFWIDENAASEFALRQGAEAGKRAAILNGDIPNFSPDMLVRCTAPDVEVSGESCSPAGRANSLLPQVFRSLCAQLDDDEDPESTAELLQRLEEEEEDDQCFRLHSVIHFRDNGHLDHLPELTTLMQELGRAVFVVLTGEQDAEIPAELKPFVIAPSFKVGPEGIDPANKTFHHEGNANRLYDKYRGKYLKPENASRGSN